MRRTDLSTIPGDPFAVVTPYPPEEKNAGRPEISVVVPVFNEEENVSQLVAAVFASLRRLGRSHEVIIVDDGSRDDTFAALRALVSDAPRPHGAGARGSARGRGGRVRRGMSPVSS